MIVTAVASSSSRREREQARRRLERLAAEVGFPVDLARLYLPPNDIDRAKALRRLSALAAQVDVEQRKGAP